MFSFFESFEIKEATCSVCKKSSPLISRSLGVCAECIKAGEGGELIKKAHAESRQRFGLPREPPKDPQGAKCTQCVNRCQIPEGGRGYCGLRSNSRGRLVHLAGTPSRGVAEWYYDPLPTNCVSAWCCAGCSSAGYPKYSHSDGAEHGYKNLAVFYGSCTYDCLFCQNWHYRENARRLSPTISAEELAARVDKKTSCVCYFGGDPSPQMPHALKASRLALEKTSGRILRLCFESNGTLSRATLERAAELSLESGGCIKFDLKAYSEELNIALSGITNSQTLSNFERLAELGKVRKEPPFLIASTLLIPGYVEAKEVERIARFIASLDREIPYSLLAFAPSYLMSDMPTTSRAQAEECLARAQEHLENVHLGNVHLLL